MCSVLTDRAIIDISLRIRVKLGTITKFLKSTLDS